MTLPMIQTLNQKKKLSPLSYTDYRHFLADYNRLKKSQNPNWSYSVWARPLGLKSSSTLIMIMKGQRNPGKSLVKGFSRYFNFNEKEQVYFADLVRLSKARTDIELSMTMLKELEKRNPEKGFKLLDQDTFFAISNWYFFTIREMILLKDFKEDAEWIAKRLRFNVTPEKAQDALDTLLRLGLIERNKRGQLQVTSKHLDTKADIANEAQKRYHEQQLEHAKKSLRELQPLEREISGGCFTIRTQNLPKAKEMIRNFQVHLCNELEERNGDNVFQLQMAFFPLTQNKKEPNL